MSLKLSFVYVVDSEFNSQWVTNQNDAVKLCSKLNSLGYEDVECHMEWVVYSIEAPEDFKVFKSSYEGLKFIEEQNTKNKN